MKVFSHKEAGKREEDVYILSNMRFNSGSEEDDRLVYSKVKVTLFKVSAREKETRELNRLDSEAQVAPDTTKTVKNELIPNWRANAVFKLD